MRRLQLTPRPGLTPGQEAAAPGHWVLLCIPPLPSASAFDEIIPNNQLFPRGSVLGLFFCFKSSYLYEQAICVTEIR